jgi:hypothetical protein
MMMAVTRDDIEQFAEISAMQSVNESLKSIGESLIKKKGLGKGKYPTSKMTRIENAVTTELVNVL